MGHWVFAFVIGIVALAGCPSASNQVAESDSLVAGLVAEINARREVAGLLPVVADAGRVEVLTRVLPRYVEDQETGLFDRSSVLTRTERLVTDWEKQCFVAEASSGDLIPDALEVCPGFAEAALDPDATHVAAATGELTAGGQWCAVCILEKLLTIGSSHGRGSPGFSGGSGSASITFNGVSGFADVLFTYYEKPTVSAEHDTTVHSVPAEVDEGGAFTATLRFGYPGCPGPGEYEIVIYARARETEEYRPTNRTRFVFR